MILPCGHPFSILHLSRPSIEKLLSYRNILTILIVLCERLGISSNLLMRISWLTLSKAERQSTKSRNYLFFPNFLAAVCCEVIHWSINLKMQIDVLLFNLKPHYSIPVICSLLAAVLSSFNARLSKYILVMSAICMGRSVFRLGKFLTSLFNTISFVQLKTSSM